MGLRLEENFWTKSNTSLTQRVPPTTLTNALTWMEIQLCKLWQEENKFELLIIERFFLLSDPPNTTFLTSPHCGVGCGAELSANQSVRSPAVTLRPSHIRIVWTSLMIPAVLERSGAYDYRVCLMLRTRHVYCCWMWIMFQIVRFKFWGCVVDKVSINIFCKGLLVFTIISVWWQSLFIDLTFLKF